MTEEPLKDARFYFGEEMPEAEIHDIACGSVAVFSKRCPGKETPNEDAAALIPMRNGSAVLIVADGLGGIPAGEQASSLAVRTVKASLDQANGPEIRDAVLNGIEMANKLVMEMGVGAATTLAIVEIQGASVRPYHVGDSTVLVLGQRGKIKFQTVSHSPVGFAQEAGLLDEKEAMHHEARHVVSNVIGLPDMRIEMGPPLELAPRDTLLIASDGLFDNLSIQEIIDRMRKGPLDQAAKNLVSDTQQRMTQPRAGEPSKPDDLTFLIYRRTVIRRPVSAKT